MNKFSSEVLQNAVDQFSSLPGVGKKTALRFVLHLLKQDDENILDFAEAVHRLSTNIIYCKKCHNISETEICHLCSNPSRDSHTICVVENIRDVIAIEKTLQYKGLYHILGGIISPMEGIGPSDLNIDSLISRISAEDINEIILALPSTLEGDTTNFFIYRKLNNNNISITTLSRGIAIGDELEYIDEITLGRSISNRRPFNETLKNNG